MSDYRLRRVTRPTLSLLTVATAALVLSAARAETPAPVYRACPGELVWSEPAKGCVCPGALHWDSATKACSAACPEGKVQVADAPPGTCASLPRTCPAGKRWSELHDGCVVSCPKSKAPNAAGTGCVADLHDCPADTQWFEARNACFPYCAPGRSLDYATATCVDDAASACAAGSRWNPTRKACEPTTAPPMRSPNAPRRAEPAKRPTTAPIARAPSPPPPPVREAPKSNAKPATCPEGKEWKQAFDGCVPICNDGEVLDFYGLACHSIRVRR